MYWEMFHPKWIGHLHIINKPISVGTITKNLKKIARKVLGKKPPVKKFSPPVQEFQTEEEYYNMLFTQDPKWSGKEPNREEASRLLMIERLIGDVQATWNANQTKDIRIVDFGCGRGWLTNKLSRYGTITGIEPVAPVVAHARKLFPALNFKTGSLELLSELQPHLIVSSEVLEHIPFDKQPGFFQSIYDALAPDGFCIITTPRAEAYKEWVSHHDTAQPVEDWLTEAQVKKLGEDAGFHVVNRLRLKERPKQSAPEIELYQLWLMQK